MTGAREGDLREFTLRPISSGLATRFRASKSGRDLLRGLVKRGWTGAGGCGSGLGRWRRLSNGLFHGRCQCQCQGICRWPSFAVRCHFDELPDVKFGITRVVPKGRLGIDGLVVLGFRAEVRGHCTLVGVKIIVSFVLPSVFIKELPRESAMRSAKPEPPTPKDAHDEDGGEAPGESRVQAAHHGGSQTMKCGMFEVFGLLIRSLFVCIC